MNNNTINPGYGRQMIPTSFQPVRSELVFTNNWTNGICDCCSDCGTCLYALFCPCCFLCTFDTNSKECPCTTICLPHLGMYMQRAKIRGAYKIQGSIFGDCCCIHFFPFCSMMQMHNEMKYKGDAN